MNKLETQYRRLFAAYPPEFRDEREDEMVSTLLDVARPGQQRADAREAVAIVWAGAQCRFSSANELQLGLRLAGVGAAGLVCMLGFAALRVTALSPIDGSATSRMVGWAVVALALCVGCRSRWGHYRIAPPAIVSVLLLVGGSEMMGMRRSFLIPVALLLVLSTLAASATLRTRVLAAIGGAAGGAALFERFLDSSHKAFGPGDVPWELASRWELAQSIAKLPMWVYLTLLVTALAGGLVRPRIAVAAALLAIPVVLLTTTRLRDLELYAGAVSVGAILTVTLVAFARSTTLYKVRVAADRTAIRPPQVP